MTSISKPIYRQQRRLHQITGGNGLVNIPVYVLQQMHHVPTGTTYVNPMNGPPDSPADAFSHVDSAGTWWHRVAVEWRDVDCVDMEGNPIT